MNVSVELKRLTVVYSFVVPMAVGIGMPASNKLGSINIPLLPAKAEMNPPNVAINPNKIKCSSSKLYSNLFSLDRTNLILTLLSIVIIIIKHNKFVNLLKIKRLISENYSFFHR